MSRPINLLPIASKIGVGDLFLIDQDGLSTAAPGALVVPRGRVDSGAAITIAPADIGGVVLASFAGAVLAALPDLSTSVSASRAISVTLQGTNAATALTVDPGAGVTIDGSAANFVAPVGKARVVLISIDGLAFYTGTP